MRPCTIIQSHFTRDLSDILENKINDLENDLFRQMNHYNLSRMYDLSAVIMWPTAASGWYHVNFGLVVI